MIESAEHLIDYANPRAGQPLDSRTVVEQHEDGVSYTFLPDGFARAMPSLLTLAAVAVALAAFPILILLGVWTAEEVGWSNVSVGLVLVFLLIPLAVLCVGVIRSAMRPTVLSIRGGRVTLFSGAAVFRPVQSWAAADVAEVEVGVRGVTSKLRLSADLNLVVRSRPSVRSLVLVIAGRDRADLLWTAIGLRASLGLPASAS